MKICIFTESIDKRDGGPSRSVPILARGLSEIGIDTTLMAVETDDMNTHLLDNTDVKLIKIPPSASLTDYIRILKEGAYDIIHSQCIWVPSYHKVAVAARKLNIPYIITPRGTLEPWSLEQKKWKKRLAMLLYQKTDLEEAACILATADMEASHIRDLNIKTPIAIIPNGIDVSEYQCRKAESRVFVKKQILFLSRIHEKKGIEYLIDSWNSLKDIYPDWNVVIAGNGEVDYIERLKKTIISYGLEKCIRIIPPVFGKEKYDLYCQSSLFVLPTYSENFGMVIAEAMSCGVPCITTNGTPWQELNENNLGWCIDLSLDNLKITLSEAIDLGQNALFEMGQRCSQHINKKYQYTEVARQNKVLYEWILNSQDMPSFVI